MDIKRRGLDRGLDALLSARAKSVIGNNADALVAETPQPGERVRELPIDLLQRGQYQPRRDFDDTTLQELATSIKAQGLIQPILVRSISDNRYEIIAGERRWRASQIAGLDKIPAIVRDIGDKPAMAIALIENIQREDLNPLEEAFALQRLSDEFQLTHEQVSETVGKSRATVTNLLRLLKLNSDVQTYLQHGDLQMGHARALLALEGMKQSQAARMIVAKALSVRETEALVRRLLAHSNKKPVRPPAVDPNVQDLQQQLAEKLGAKVTLHANPKGKGKLEIQFNSLDELDGILERIR